jgi:aspartate/methionine/tyrosine aminotransferase
MTGWRMGATIGPRQIIEIITKMNVNDESCSNHFIQYAMIEALTGDQTEVKKILQTLKERRDAAVDLANSINGVRCFKPNATFYLFPNATGLMKNKGILDYNEFRIKVLQETGVSFCTRLHFGRPLKGENEYYIRLAYSGIPVDQIREGLAKLRQWAE